MADHIYLRGQVPRVVGDRNSNTPFIDYEGRQDLYPWNEIKNHLGMFDQQREYDRSVHRQLSAIKQRLETRQDTNNKLVEQLEKVRFPNGDRFVMRNFIGGGLTRYTGTAYSVSCSPELQCVTFDIVVWSVKTNTIVAEKKGINAGELAFGKGFNPAQPYFIEGDDALIFDVVFNSAPYKDKDGNYAFASECDPPLCMSIRVHHLLEETCMSDVVPIGGCLGGCCYQIPAMKCCIDTLNKTCDSQVQPVIEDCPE